MNVAQEVFERELSKLFTLENLGYELITKKLEDYGLELTEQQADLLRKQLKKKGDSLTFDFDDKQIEKAGYKSEKELGIKLQSLFKDVNDELESFSTGFVDNLPELILSSATSLAEDTLSDLKRSLKETIQYQKADRESFEVNLFEIYEKPLENYELFIVMATEAGSSINSLKRRTVDNEGDFVFEALSRLHARACQVSREILTLLESGLADGAHARWRTLHEISVITLFISEAGQECAEKYLLHGQIESWKAANTYQENCDSLGFEPFNHSELEELTKAKDLLIKRFGKEYFHEYGWASKELNKFRPTFYDVEKSSGLAHLRPFYKMACHNVHAGSKGMFFKLGLKDDSDDILLAGRSILGLTEPGQSAVISLNQITTTFLVHDPNIDRIATSKMMALLADEIIELFAKAEESIELGSIVPNEKIF